MHKSEQYDLLLGAKMLGETQSEDTAKHKQIAGGLDRAQRTGYGVDLTIEDNTLQTIPKIKQQHKVVKICLTSNEQILNLLVLVFRCSFSFLRFLCFGMKQNIYIYKS
ncbi:unnamed protein product [Didymodactylos carnosus]|uniref:Uncharacterized protein n=2 Tax=Didymodactylos carnosus TaxID=1234261 RepID=A0A815GUQ9_9BILA|nr:unnamed protein product [Didymodactylos carnosus]CAF4206561.1 unnamed protein product [Didymodactylos carnosus]